MIKKITWCEDKKKADGEPYMRMRIEGGLFIGVWEKEHFDLVRDTAKRKGEADITFVKKGDFYNLKSIVPVIQTIEQLKQAEKVERTDKWAPWPINQMGMCFMAAQKNAIPLALRLLEERGKSTEDQAVNLVKTISDTLYKWLIQQQERAIWEYENAEGLKEPEAKEAEEEEVEMTEEMIAGDSKGNPGDGEEATQTPLDTVSDGQSKLLIGEGTVDVDDIPDGLKSEEQLKETADARLTKHDA